MKRCAALAAAAATAVATVWCGPAAAAAAPAPEPVPRLVGQGLQSALDRARADGLTVSRVHDASGSRRIVFITRNWRVCEQTPPPGRTTAPAALTLGVVKLDERCPAGGSAPPLTAGGRMPDFTGRRVTDVHRTLDTGTSIRATDVSGRDRTVLWPRNWKVCSQRPAAGERREGRPVVLGVVRNTENCPAGRGSTMG